LERNVTLSSGYLEELSVRYKKQIDELQLSVRQSVESLGAANKARQQDRAHMQTLTLQLADLASNVDKMAGKIQSVSLITYLHLTFIVVELTVGILVLVCCWRSKRDPAEDKPRQQASPAAPTVSHRSTSPLRRTTSEEVIALPTTNSGVEEIEEPPGRRRSLAPTEEAVEHQDFAKSEPAAAQPTVSKKQRRRENRRKTIALLGGGGRRGGAGPLTPPAPSAAHHGSNPGYYDTFHHTSSPSFPSPDWQRVTRAGSAEVGGAGRLLPQQHPQMSPMANGQVSPGMAAAESHLSPGRFLVQPVVNVFVNNDPVVTSNKYGCLNSSVHGNEATPGGPPPSWPHTCGTSSSGHPQLHHPRRRLFDHCHDEESEEDRALSPNGGKGQKGPGKKRSKSTSPTRRRPADYQRDLYRNINPDTATWKQ